MAFENPSREEIKNILEQVGNIAVVGFWCEIRIMIQYIILSGIHIMYICLEYDMV
nr:hypothetical protein [Paenibacillus polymyxa]